MYGKYYLPSPVCNTSCTLNLFFFHVLKTLPFQMIFPPPPFSSSLFLILCAETLVTNTMTFLSSQNHDTFSSILKLKKITLLQPLGDKPWFWYTTFLPESKECYPNGVEQYLLLWEERLFSWKKILPLSWNIPFSDKCDLYSNLKNFMSSIFKVKKSQTRKCDE